MNRPHDTPREQRIRTGAQVLLDAWLEGDRAYWERRAREFAAVGTPACNEIAQACANRATLSDVAAHELLDTLNDIATGDAAAQHRPSDITYIGAAS